MENMPAAQPFRAISRSLHLLPADDTNAVDGLCKFLCTDCLVPPVHIQSGLTILEDVIDSQDKGPEGQVQIADDMDRNSVIRNDGGKEDGINQEL